MVRRQKNLLEAFNASGVEKHAPKLPGLMPPPAPVAPAPRVKKSSRRAEPVIPRRARIQVDPRRLAIFGGILVVLVIVFFSGRMSGDDVEAQNSSAETGTEPNALLTREAEQWAEAANAPIESPSQAPIQSPVQPQEVAETFHTPDDRAFHDPLNKFTVRVIAFRRDERGQQLAWDCYYYLREEGLPAITPVGQGASVMLYVGASSDRAELERIADYISNMRGPPPQSRAGEFEKAYLVNIENQIVRDER